MSLLRTVLFSFAVVFCTLSAFAEGALLDLPIEQIKTQRGGVEFSKWRLDVTVRLHSDISTLKLGDEDGNAQTDDPQILIYDMTFSHGDEGRYARIYNPYIEFASLGDQLVGVRVGAEGVDGVLGMGRQDDSANCLDRDQGGCQDTGIRRMHGYMKTLPVKAVSKIGEIRLSDFLAARGEQRLFDLGNGRSAIPGIDNVDNLGNRLENNIYNIYYPEFIENEPLSDVNYYQHYFYNRLLSPKAQQCIIFYWGCGPEPHTAAGRIDNTLDGIGWTVAPAEYGTQQMHNIPSIDLPVEVPSIVINTEYGSQSSIPIDLGSQRFYDVEYVSPESLTVERHGTQSATFTPGVLYVDKQ
ncbi:MAG: hypothetical protein SVC26_05545, partial [Pseudomonadota bacterium]|nr:hypothetical protein [Pseudomonadota bacterium]